MSLPARQRRVVSITLILVIALAGVALVVFRYRAIAALGEALRQRAAADGVTLNFGSARVGLRETTLRDVQVTVARAPGLKMTADTVTVRPGSTTRFDVAVGRAQVTVDATALGPVSQLPRLGLWRVLSLTWGRLSVTHTNRLTGQVQLDHVTVEPPQPAASPAPASADAVVLRAGGVTLGTRRWSDVVMTVQSRGPMMDLGLGAATIQAAPVVIGVFPSEGGAWGFVGTIAHPPAPVLARALGIALGPQFGAARVGGSFSFTIPDDLARPPTGRLELLVSGWPSPAEADAAVVLGTTIGLGAKLAPAPDRSRVVLPSVRMSTSLFSLGGTGSLGLGSDLPLAVDLTGSLTCAQIRGNLRPSPVLDAVSGYLGPPDGDGEGSDKTRRPPAVAARLRETVTMRIQFDGALAGPTPPRLAWEMEPGCGFAGFSSGTFAPAPPAN